MGHGGEGITMKSLPLLTPTFRRWWAGVLGLAVAVLVTGCATGTKTATGPSYVFYPPAPAVPRLQFLVSYSDELDLGATVSKMATFITGAQPHSQPIVKPYGLALVNKQLYVCDSVAGAVEILDFEKKSMRVFAPGGLAMLKTPINIAVDTDGTRYVADAGRGQVLIYGAQDAFLGAIQDPNLKPTSVAVTADRLYVMDLEGHCVRVYEKAGRKPLFTIPRDPQADQPGHLFMPVNFALDVRGRVYVSDTASCQIVIYEADGRYVRSFGGRGDLPGQFVRPKGVAVDRVGRVYVVDAASQVCQIFDANDKLLAYFGEPDGSPTPLTLPAAVVVDDQHLSLFQKYVAPDFVVEQLVIISNQFGDRKISVYGLGHRR